MGNTLTLLYIQNMDIKLVDLEKEDLELVRNWRNSEEVSSYLYTADHISPEQQQKWFESISASEKNQHWIIMYNGKKVGVAAITGIDPSLQSCYWQFYLGDTSNRGVGIGAKIEYNVLDYVFSELKLNKLRCEVFVSNDRVIKMHEKFGFRREAFYREHCIKDGEKLDVVGLAMLSSEWDTNKTRLKEKVYGK